MRVDAHQHFWTYRPERYPWIDERMALLKRDFSPRDLKPLLDECGIAGSVAVQARHDVSETRELIALAEEHPFVLGVVGWVDLSSKTVEPELAALAAHSVLVGVRHAVQDEPDDRFLLRDDFRRGLALLSSYGLAYDLLVYPRQLGAATDLVSALPDQRFVLDHIGKPPIASGALEPWATALRALAAAGDVYCKLSGMVTEADWQNWRRDDLRPYLDVVFEAFGVERLMVGSDWPVCTLAGRYTDVMRIVDDYVARLATSERDAIRGGNASAFYALEAPDDATS